MMRTDQPPKFEEIEAAASVRELGPSRFEIELDKDHARRMVIGRRLTVTIYDGHIEVGAHALGALDGVTLTLRPEADALACARAYAAAQPLQFAMSVLRIQALLRRETRA